MKRLEWPKRLRRPGTGKSEARKEDKKEEDSREPAFSTKGIRRLYVVVMVLSVALLAVDVTRPQDWEVDETTVGLLFAVALLPLLDRLRKLKLGSFEVELEDEVSGLRARVDRLEVNAAEAGTRQAERRDDQDEEPAPEAVGQRELTPMVGGGAGDKADVLPSPIDRIVWVDDEPDQNEPIVAQLRTRFDVRPVTTTGEALELVSSAPKQTLVITDAVRVEQGTVNYAAGRNLLDTLRREHPQVPVIVFASPATVRDHEDKFLDSGARAVTASVTELTDHVAAIARRRFRAAVADVVSKSSGTAEGDNRSHWFVRLADGHRVRVEARDWRRRPSAAAAEKVWARAHRDLKEKVDEVLIAVPAEAGTQAGGRPDRVTVLTLPALAARLGVPTVT